MKVINLTLIALVSVTAFFALLGSAVAVKVAPTVFVALLILKLTGLLSIAWFAPITTLSVFGTTLFLVIFGILGIIINMLILGISNALVRLTGV